MSEKNFLICGDNTAIAVSKVDVEQVVAINDEQMLHDLRELIEQRRELGIQLSRKLKDQGLDSADNTVAQVLYDDPRELIEQRSELGIRLSGKLKDQGLDSADNNNVMMIDPTVQVAATDCSRRLFAVDFSQTC